MKKIIYILSFFMFFSCERDIESIKNTEIVRLISSDKVEDNIRGYYIIGEQKNIDLIDKLFDDISDVRISHHYRYKGISVYQSKMIALKKIFGKEPPQNITNVVDTTITNFYYKWALKKEYIK
ncbi:hypothetical protein [Tenacibaculum aiptasiae]|uniref:hypothetical protein n=1 Tax=Tenacibaculum aiptasiae TaxID=426481 RepID=UPI00232CE51A|nr:hypothetical protein [Tenacibaculum aiptasiae]